MYTENNEYPYQNIVIFQFQQLKTIAECMIISYIRNIITFIFIACLEVSTTDTEKKMYLFTP